MNTNRTLAFILAGAAVLSLLLSLLVPEGLGIGDPPPSFISVVDVANKIHKREDIRLVDLRSSALYDSFHIPTAENIDMENLLSQQNWTDEITIFYSGDDGKSRELWNKLPESVKKRTFILYGGVHDWYDYILYPNLPINTNSENDSLITSQVERLSDFYGGQARYLDTNLDYYKKNLSMARWPQTNRKKGLVRMGC